MLTHPLSADVIFQSRRQMDERLGNFVKAVPGLNSLDELEGHIEKNSVVICGYPDDEGIKLNGGRLGAANGPDSIRTFFYKMTPISQKNNPGVCDLGNINLGEDLEKRHDLGRQLAHAVLSKKHFRWVGLGGGHDYGFSDGAGFLDAFGKGKQKPLILNFDAHLDVRVLDRGLNSGTPFRRLIENYKNFDFAEIGIQSLCNNPAYVDWVKKNNVKIIWNEDLLLGKKDFLTLVKKRLGPWLKKGRPTFLSIDVDGFSSAFAPGCSQSWPSGFTPKDFFPVFDFILKTLDVRALGIYEVSPELDVQNQTSKLAAEILYRFTHGN